jgi:hypothetical protein
MPQIMVTLAKRMSSDIKTPRTTEISQFRRTSIQNKEVARQQGRKCVKETEIS